jgi:hypothetical protein
MRMLNLTILGALLMSACGGEQPEDTGVDKTTAAVYVAEGFTEDPVRPGYAPTQCHGMHCCPDGYAMQGAYLASNMFRCARLMSIVTPGSENSQCKVDYGTQRNNMHACQSGYYMKGLNVGANQLTCCPWPEPFTGEYVDANGSTQYHSPGWNVSAHTCTDYGGGGGEENVMTGIRVDQNTFLCGL